MASKIRLSKLDFVSLVDDPQEPQIRIGYKSTGGPRVDADLAEMRRRQESTPPYSPGDVVEYQRGEGVPWRPALGSNSPSLARRMRPWNIRRSSASKR